MSAGFGRNCLGSVSVLALMAAMAALPQQAQACNATAEGVDASVTVVCGAEETSDLFLTSFAYAGDGVIVTYDGDGDDVIVITGGEIGDDLDAPPPPITNTIAGGEGNLDESDVVFQTLGGNDQVTISGGTVFGGIIMNAGDDYFEMTGGEVQGSILGDDEETAGDDTFVVSGGTIGGSIFAGGGADTVTVSDEASIGLADEAFDSVGLESGDDTFTMTGGTLAGAVSGGTGIDTLTISGGEIGTFVAGNEGDDVISIEGGTIGTNVLGGEDDDEITISGGLINGFVDLGDGTDTLTMTGGEIGEAVFGGGDADTVDISGGIVGTSVITDTGDDSVSISGTAEIGEDVATGEGEDSIEITGGSIGGSVFAGAGGDTIDVSGGTIEGAVLGEGGDDVVTVSGEADIGIGAAGPNSVDLGGGDDDFTMTGGMLAGDVSGGTGLDTFDISGGEIGGSVTGGDGGDVFDVSGGSIAGSIFGDEGNDGVTISGDADIGVAEGEVDSVGLGAGDDSVTMTGGRLAGALSGGAGADTFDISGGTIESFISGGEADDVIDISGGTVAGSVYGDAGDDSVMVSGDAEIGISGEEIDSVGLGEGDDRFTMSGGALAGSVSGGSGADSFDISGGTIATFVAGGEGDDSIGISGGTISGSVYGDAGDDSVTISGDAEIGISGEEIDSVGLGEGDDRFTMSGGALAGSVSGGSGTDTFDISGGTIGTFVAGGEDDDVINVSGGTIEGSIFGDDGDDEVNVSGGTVAGSVIGGGGADTVSVSGGTIEGDIQAETVTLTGGTIGGDITGISADTLTIEADDLTLRDGVLFSGTGAVGTITATTLAAGGFSQNFAGFASLGLFEGSTLRFTGGTQGIAELILSSGSTLFATGTTTLWAGEGLGNLTLMGSTLNMVNGSTADTLNVGNLTLDGGTLAIDLDAEAGLADRINAAGAIAASGANTIAVSLVGPLELGGPIVVAIVPVAGETPPVDGEPSPLFTIAGLPDDPAALFDFTVITGPDGGLYLFAEPGSGLVLATATRVAIDSRPIENVTATVGDIINDAILTRFGLLASTGRTDAAPNFGIYATGQLAGVKHDGFSVSGGGFSGVTPGFDATDFSLAASLELDAAQYFGFDDVYGLDVGVFGGYASTRVDMDPTSLFSEVGDGENRSGMFGSYALFRSGTTYGLVSATGFAGRTDITNDVLGSSGDYGTFGYAFTATAGHVFQINENWRFDLRGGILGASFRGDEFTDSVGNDFGSSRISFGAIKFEPGLFARYVMENNRIFSPYLRTEFQQRFDYKNTSSLDGVAFAFDDADFSASVSAGANYQFAEKWTASGEVRGKFSEDSRTFGGKIGVKVRF